MLQERRSLRDIGLASLTISFLTVFPPILVMTIATFMILNQLKIAPAIVTITYAALLGAVALGSALAFGLGGRDVAARMLEGAYASAQQNKEQWKRDLDQGLARARVEAEQAKEPYSETDTQPGRPAVAGTGPRYAVTRTPATPAPGEPSD